jgi:pimeloyl-ACP methyl ester carboxylesterase
MNLRIGFKAFAGFAVIATLGWTALSIRSGFIGLDADARIGDPIRDDWSARKKFVDVGGVPVAYIDVGQGPPLLLLHGCPFSSVVWKDVAPLLPGRRLLAPDLLGLGDTRVTLSDDYQLPREAAMVVGFLDALGIGAVDIVGADHGGATLQLLLAHHPERVKLAVLTNAEAYDSWPSAPERPYLEAVTNPFLSPLFHLALGFPAVQRRVFDIAVHSPGALTDETLTAFVDAHIASAVRWQRLVRFYRWQLDPDHRQVTLAAVPGLRRFDRPVLILWGEADGNFGRAIAERLAADLPGSQLRWIPDAGHLPMLEAPQLYAAALREFLEEGSAQ